MQEITGTIAIGCGKFRVPDWIDGIKMLPGVQRLYENIAMASRGQDHAYPSQKWLAKKTKVSERSIRNYTKALIALQLIAQRIERIKGRLRKVYYLLAHPAIVAEAQRKNLPVTAENFSAHLNKGKSCTESPPCPRRGKPLARWERAMSIRRQMKRRQSRQEEKESMHLRLPPGMMGLAMRVHLQEVAEADTSPFKPKLIFHVTPQSEKPSVI